jgi:RNA polymerase sigma factor (TIGR02999 family)
MAAFAGGGMAVGADVTGLLIGWSNGDEAARSRLLEAVYGELRRLARARLRRERGEHTLSPTALVHEAYLRLIDQQRVQWQGRAHFFAVAARLMRRILVDHARAHQAVKRRNPGIRVPSPDAEAGPVPRDPDVLALDEALDRLAAIDRRQSDMVELRFFAGLNIEETAAVLEVSPVTVKRDWALARAWLYRELRDRDDRND